MATPTLKEFCRKMKAVEQAFDTQARVDAIMEQARLVVADMLRSHTEKCEAQAAPGSGDVANSQCSSSGPPAGRQWRQAVR